MLHDSTGSYTPDMAAEIDSAEEIAADDYGVGIRIARRILADREAEVRRNQAETLARVIGMLLLAKNPRITIRCLALAFGFDSMNGYHSQSEVAKEEGVTRALISHYVLGWRDVLTGGAGSFDCMKFRKKQGTRETFRKAASSSFLAAKEAAREKQKQKTQT